MNMKSRSIANGLSQAGLLSLDRPLRVPRGDRSILRRKTADELPDAGQDRLLIAREGPVIAAVELDESRLRDVAREMPAGADANNAVAATVQHQSRRGNSAEKMPHIGIAQCLDHPL